MLTSSANQYLRPEYLTPLPTTLDAKKSPLALLAQTCSQIGADPPSGKSLLAPLDGKTSTTSKSSKSSSSSSSSSDQSREKSSPATQQAPPQQQHETVKSSFKPYESCLGREKASSPEETRAPSSHSTSGRSRTPGSGSKRCSSNQSASSARAATPQGRRTATPNGDATRESPSSRAGSTAAAASESSQQPSSQSQSSSPMQSKSSYSPAGVLAMTDPSLKDLPLGTFKPGSSMPVSTSAAYLGYPPQLPIDVMASSLMSQHHAALKNGLTSNPYLSYARMKTSTGADTLVPICRDPFCTGCQLNPHYMSQSATSGAKVPTSTAAGGCPAGCAQCDHKPSSAAASPYGAMSAAHSSAAAAYAHAQLAALAAASQLPYVCNWITGDGAYCGKRFPSSEELLQHLRSHTSVSGDPSAAAALSLLSPPGLPPTHPLLSRTYPTPPLSPLATARYHPYGKPSPLMPPSLSSLGLALPPHHPAAGLPPYFSPYSLYGGPRLGAASGMHP